MKSVPTGGIAARSAAGEGSHRFQVVEIDGQRLAGAVQDTVLVLPKGRVVIAFDANNPEWWAFHLQWRCHC